MKQASCTVLVSTLVLVLGFGRAVQAQPGQYSKPAGTPSSRPAVSPYLDLTRGGDTAFNYHRRVRPEMEWRAATAQDRQLIVHLGQQQDEAKRRQISGLKGTGHAAQFMTYSHFYQLGR
jgi:hypothetical protein